MKTKIKTRQVICLFAIIGLMNINAVAGNKKSANTEVVAVKEEMLTNELKRSDEAFFNSAEALTAMEADAQIDKYATKQILLKENTIAKSDFQATAESITASGTDREIEKYALKQVALEQTRIGK